MCSKRSTHFGYSVI